MSSIRHLSICVAVLAGSSLAPACRATTPAPEIPPLAEGKPIWEVPPRSDIWVTYSPGGMRSSSIPQGDGSAIVSGGGLRPPIFSVRLASRREDRSIDADLATPGGFDSRDVRAADISDDGWGSDVAGRHEAELERALKHHRPVVRLSINGDGETKVRRSPALGQHEAYARRLLRAAIVAKVAEAENEVQRESELERLQEDLLAPVSAPVEHGSRLLQLAMLPLPPAADAYDAALKRIAAHGPLAGQAALQARQIRDHGRPVRLQLDMLTMADSPAARLCRSLTYREISSPSSDTCTIEGYIDRRDGWPVTLSIAREGETADGAKESESRSFHRLAPLEGFEPPPNPCPAQ